MAAAHSSFSFGKSFIDLIKIVSRCIFIGYDNSKPQDTSLTGQLTNVMLSAVYTTPAQNKAAANRLLLQSEQLNLDNLANYIIELRTEGHTALNTIGEPTFAPRVFMLASFIILLAEKMYPDPDISTAKTNIQNEISKRKEKKEDQGDQKSSGQKEKDLIERFYLGDITAISHQDDLERIFPAKLYDYLSKKSKEEKAVYGRTPEVDANKPLQLQDNYAWFFCKKDFWFAGDLTLTVQLILSMSGIDFVALQKKAIETLAASHLDATNALEKRITQLTLELEKHTKAPAADTKHTAPPTAGGVAVSAAALPAGAVTALVASNGAGLLKQPSSPVTEIAGAEAKSKPKPKSKGAAASQD